MPVKYTDEECNFIRKNGSQLTTNELWLAIERTFHTGHTKQSVRTKAKQLGVIKTKDARSRASDEHTREISYRRQSRHERI